MEGIFLILIGAALFSQSWYVLGMYSEGRTMGILVGGLGLLSLATITALAFAPMLLTGEGKGADMLAETTVMKSMVLMWALYAVGVGAHGLWDLEDRAIGFYAAFLAVATLVPFIYFARELESSYGVGTWLALSGSSLILTVLAGIMFFYLAFALNVLRLVAGWFLLLGGGAVAVIGLAIVSTFVTND
jgi:hypothetical protein